MTRAIFRWVLGVGLAGWSVVAAGAAEPVAEGRKPNIVVLLADDLGWGECGFQGFTTDVPTPNLDRLAAGGVRFTNGYVAATYCSPSRAGLMTGRYPTRFGHEFNGNGPNFGLPRSETTLATRLKALGYATCAIGKWHLGDEPEFQPTARGFDEYLGSLANPGSYYRPSKWVDSLGRVKPGGNFYTTDAFADRAVDWIGRHRDGPFFLYVPFNAVHAPLEAPKKYLGRFKGMSDQRRWTFAAMLSAMDDAVGRILAALDANGLTENTLVVFLSDNGGPTRSTTSGNGPLRGFKATTSEGGTRVPFVLRWPGRVRAGEVYDRPVVQLDLLPTFVTAAGGRVDPAWKIDGVDLLPYLTGAATGRPHETLYWRFGDQWAIRDGDWKLVVSRVDGNRPRLIDLADDPAEANDLAKLANDRVKALTAKWQAWDAEQAEPLWRRADPGKKRRRQHGSEVDD